MARLIVDLELTRAIGEPDAESFILGWVVGTLEDRGAHVTEAKVMQPSDNPDLAEEKDLAAWLAGRADLPLTRAELEELRELGDKILGEISEEDVDRVRAVVSALEEENQAQSSGYNFETFERPPRGRPRIHPERGTVGDYQCPYCPKKFETQRGRSKHMSAMHTTTVPQEEPYNEISGVGPLTCPDCGKKFDTPRSLGGHRSAHKIVTCGGCGQEFRANAIGTHSRACPGPDATPEQLAELDKRRQQIRDSRARNGVEQVEGMASPMIQFAEPPAEPSQEVLDLIEQLDADTPDVEEEPPAPTEKRCRACDGYPGRHSCPTGGIDPTRSPLDAFAEIGPMVGRGTRRVDTQAARERSADAV